MPHNISGLIIAAGVMFAVLVGITVLSNVYSLNIKAKTLGKPFLASETRALINAVAAL